MPFRSPTPRLPPAARVNPAPQAHERSELGVDTREDGSTLANPKNDPLRHGSRFTVHGETRHATRDTRNEIRDTRYEIRDTRYEIRDTRSVNRAPPTPCSPSPRPRA